MSYFYFLHVRESFAFVRGAVLLLEEGEREGPHEEATPSLFPNAQLVGGASDTKRKHLHAMISLLRPEDSVKLVRYEHHIVCLFYFFYKMYFIKKYLFN